MNHPTPPPHGVKWNLSEPSSHQRNLERDTIIYHGLSTQHADALRSDNRDQAKAFRAEMLVVANRMTKSREAMLKAEYKSNNQL